MNGGENIKDSCIAKNIKRIIEEKGYKHAAIADKAGIPRKTFSNMLNNRKMIADYNVREISIVLGVTPNDLFGIRPDAKP